MKIKIPKYLKLFLKIAITAGALYLVFTNIDGNKMLGIYKDAKFLYLIFALVLFIISKFLAALRLNYFFRNIKIRISEKANLKLYLLGMFYNVFLPGGISGDGYKIYLLRKKFEVKTGKIFSAVLIDRISGIFALFILSLTLFYFIQFEIPFKFLVWALIPLSYFVFYFLIKRFFKAFEKIMIRTSLFSLGVQISQLICAWLIMQALNIKLLQSDYLFVFLISSIVAILPVTIGGIGSREVTFYFGAQVLGLDVNQSIGLSLMFYAITLVVSLSGIIYTFKQPIFSNTNQYKNQT
ncbi:MAG: flippase-like domain-containing protein [Bacteroidales bacterium]|nr:flippase-like domain-containing protein [Bacteroidales bacterium]